MCGICGIVSDTGDVITSERVERMATTIRHRGPDDGVNVDTTPHASVGLAIGV